MATRRRRHLAEDPLTVVNRFVDAANRHDAHAVAACVHRDFESVQPIHPVRNFKGSAQLLTNWRAIFRTEPGFRLTMLRSAVEGDTVWAELHGAGQSAEVAGIFIIGVEDGLIRWARVYSELVEPMPEPAIPEPLAASVAAEADAEEAAPEEEPDEYVGVAPELRVVEDESDQEAAASVDEGKPEETSVTDGEAEAADVVAGGAVAGGTEEPEALAAPEGGDTEEPPAVTEEDAQAVFGQVLSGEQAPGASDADEVEVPEIAEPLPGEVAVAAEPVSEERLGEPAEVIADEPVTGASAGADPESESQGETQSATDAPPEAALEGEVAPSAEAGSEAGVEGEPSAPARGRRRWFGRRRGMD